MPPPPTKQTNKSKSANFSIFVLNLLPEVRTLQSLVDVSLVKVEI